MVALTTAAIEDSPVANRLRLALRPTRRLREALLIAAVVAARDGRRAISTADLREAVSAPVRPRREWRRPRGAPLDAAARRLWTQAEAEAELLAHPYLAPEHIALVGAGEADRARLLAALGTPFARHRWWQPLGRHSAARPAAAAERQRRALLAAQSHGGKGDSPA